jgi:hypothetical protein
MSITVIRWIMTVMKVAMSTTKPMTALITGDFFISSSKRWEIPG